MKGISKSLLAKIHQVPIKLTCHKGHDYEILQEDGWLYLICLQCLDRKALTTREMEAIRSMNGGSGNDKLFRIFGEKHTRLYSLLENTASYLDKTPEELMILIIDKYFQSKSFSESQIRRLKVIQLFKSGIRIKEIAAEMNVTTTAIKQILKQEGLYMPRKYAQR